MYGGGQRSELRNGTFIKDNKFGIHGVKRQIYRFRKTIR
jgi:hypothetical protein